ncbi:conserved hypothetical protein [Mesorhizobium sp. STM 4661]|nr:conserved hypothetical protein [Mesorhizobium sp. STM 4661]
MLHAIGLDAESARNRHRWSPLVIEREDLMNNSVHQARWLLAPIFVVSIAFLAIGMIVG